MKKQIFNELPLKVKTEYYQKVYESTGVFKNIVENSYKKNIDTKEISSKIRVKIEKLLVDKNIVTTAHYKDMGPWMGTVIKMLLQK